MATITPVTTRLLSRYVATWTGVSTADTATAVEPDAYEPLAGAVSFAGTWGGATGILQASNDNTTWFPLVDVGGNAISFTVDGIAEFSTQAYRVGQAIT